MSTKIRYLSDLHLEFEDYEISTDNDEDVLIIAGDLTPTFHDATFLIEDYLMNKSNCLILFVLGNHDFYHSTINETKTRWKEFETKMNSKYPENKFRVLINELEIVDNIWFYGCTLWSDMNGCNHNMIQRCISDFKMINYFTPNEMIKEHIYEKGKVEDVIKNFNIYKSEINKDIKLVIITHFLPCHQSIDKKYFGNPMNAYFACSDIDHLIKNANYWVHGHTHSSLNYKFGDCQILCNPKGYNSENEKFNDNEFFKL